MKNKILVTLGKSIALLTLVALVSSTFGVALAGSVRVARAAAPDVQVTILKYIDGAHATTATASSSDFTMSATWNATNIGAGTGTYALGATGFNSPNPYEAVTSMMTSGADYSTQEVTGGAVVGASCTTGQPFALVGYTSGDTLAQALSTPPSLTPPTFTGMTTDKFVIVWNRDCSVPATVRVTINKYVDGQQATATSAGSQTFPMTASWNDPSGIGSGTGQYDLNGSTTPAYQAQTVSFNSGADYSTSENTNGTSVGASCASGKPYARKGYTTGNSLAAAQAGTLSTTTPSFTNMTSDEYVIVWNKTCVPTPTPVAPANGSATTTAGQTSVSWTSVTDAAGGITYVYQSSNASTTNPNGSFTTPAYTSGPLSTTTIATPGTPEGTYYWHVQATDANSNKSPWSTMWSFVVDNTPTTTPPTAVNVTIKKYVDGQPATASSSEQNDFPMTATWNDPGGIGSGSGQYTLSQGGFNGDPTPYQAITANMQSGADYTTNEITTGSVVGTSCAASTTPQFALAGYTTGNTLAQAAAATPTTTAARFTGLTQNKYVIVWNTNCNVPPPVATSTGALMVTSVDPVDTTATADNTYENGWTFVFNITVPTNETNLAMKFADWMSTTGSSTIPAANNMRISSTQADNGGVSVPITAANTYSTPDLHMTGDLNAALPGLQVQVKVEMKIPTGTVNNTYTTTYGVRSL